MGVIVVSLCLPTAVRRLRGLKINRYLSLLLFLLPVFSVRNLKIFGSDISANLTYLFVGLWCIGCIAYTALVLLSSNSSSTKINE